MLPKVNAAALSLEIPSTPSKWVQTCSNHFKPSSVSVLLDEGTDLGIFVHHFLSSHLCCEQLLQLRIAELWCVAVVGLQRFEDVRLLTIQVVLRLLGQAQEGQLGGVGDEGKP